VRWSHVTGAAIAATTIALAAVSPAAHMPPSTNIETVAQVGPDATLASHASRERGAAGDTALPSGPAPSRERRMARIIRHIWPDASENQAIRVARCESGLNPNTINWRDQHANGPGSFGLFQLARVHTWAWTRSPLELLQPWRNARAALRLYRGHGGTFRRAWVHCSRKVGAR